MQHTNGMHKGEGWKEDLLTHLSLSVPTGSYWEECLRRRTIHLAVMVEPYMQYILDGLKTIESRFSVNQCAPYNQVEKNDVIALKVAAGPIVALCEVAHVNFYRLDASTWNDIRSTFTEALCAQDPGFWEKRQRASFATLMGIKNVRKIHPFECGKRDRRGWVVVKLQDRQMRMDNI